MNTKEFIKIRRALGKTQKELSHLLGTSLKAVQSFEQGWRKIPVYIERQLLFLATIRKPKKKGKPCWVQLKCPVERKEKCPTWEYQCEDLCWFINGTICRGKIQDNWEKKMKMCRKCEVFHSHLDNNLK